MRPRSLLGLGWSIVLLLAACSAVAPSTQGPGGATSTQAPRPSSAAPTLGNVQGGVVCPDVPLIDQHSPVIPSFAPDADLAARFPTQIDGQPVTGIETFNWAQVACAYGGQFAVDERKGTIPARFHFILGGLTYGTADATVDGGSVEIKAYRVAGQDGSLLTALHGEIAQMIDRQSPTGFSNSVRYVSLGGKNVTVWTDTDSNVVTYIYPSGDVVFAMSDVSESQAGKIFAALP